MLGVFYGFSPKGRIAHTFSLVSYSKMSFGGVKIGVLSRLLAKPHLLTTPPYSQGSVGSELQNHFSMED